MVNVSEEYNYMIMPLTEVVYDEKSFSVTADIKAAFDRDGCVMVRQLLDADEMSKILKAVSDPDGVLKHAYGKYDGTNRKTGMTCWNQPGTDVTGMLARSDKVAGTVEKLLGGEVYHYHSKVMMKNPKVGGDFLWHQDYGYWYHNGNLRPDMLSAYISLDKCVKENGCLEAVLGTHQCGRIDHNRQFTEKGIRSSQAVADDERVQQLLKHFEHLYVESNPGDCLFFHCNLLHKAAQNDSDMRRWALICCYNRADNDPVIDQVHSKYIPLQRVPNSAIKECENVKDLSGKEFLIVA